MAAAPFATYSWTGGHWPDALGLGLFAASGAQVAHGLGSPAVVVVIMGTVTAVFGGVLRDLFCAQVPTAFTDHRPYAVCAALGAAVTLVALNMAAPQWLALSLGAALASGVRLLSLRYDWRLMQWQHDAHETPAR